MLNIPIYKEEELEKLIADGNFWAVMDTFELQLYDFLVKIAKNDPSTPDQPGIKIDSEEERYFEQYMRLAAKIRQHGSY